MMIIMMAVFDFLSFQAPGYISGRFFSGKGPGLCVMMKDWEDRIVHILDAELKDVQKEMARVRCHSATEG